jgi:predicted metalloprotease with PDZ domain
MSRHLWLYEGVTEYFAQTVQVKYNLLTRDEYLAEMRQKMLIADRFLDEVPFTDISLGALDKYADQYYNVYQKGALIGLCLDVKLRALSKGEYGIQNLIADLSKQYGKSKAFLDEELFATIATLTYPEIGDFLNRYVGGTEKLPLHVIFESVGVTYLPEREETEYSSGLETKAMKVTDYKGKKVFQIKDTEALNDQGQALNFLKDDIIVSINGNEMPEFGPEVQSYFEKVKKDVKNNPTIKFEVLRAGENLEFKKIYLEAPVIPLVQKKIHVLGINQDATSEQLALRDSWLGSH